MTTATTTSREEILRALHSAVTGVDPRARVVLFGSRARGDAREDSDWDLLILPTTTIDIALRNNFYDAIYDLELKFEEPFSLNFFPLSEWESGASPGPLYDIIRREGIPL